MGDSRRPVLLVLRVIALLQQDDAPLAHGLTVSTDDLWTTLADPGSSPR